MRFAGRGSKYYRQLVLSYLIIVISIAILVGVLSANYFSAVYNRELIDLNQNMLFHLDGIIEESTLGRALELYDELAVKNPNNLALHELFNVPLRGNFALVKTVSDYLGRIVGANHNLIDSIHIYFQKNDVVISSRNGIVYPEDGVFDMDNLWLSQYRETKEPMFWMPMRTIDRIEPIKIVSVVKAFPAISGYGDSKGLICINIRESAIYNIIKRQRDAGEELIVLTPDGRLVSDTSSGGLLHNELDSFAADSNQPGNTIQAFSGVKHMVSYRTIGTSNWRIIKTTPIKDFRRNLVRIRLMIVLICFASVIIGLIVTLVFSARMYNPLRTLVEKLGERTMGKTDEYTLINQALDNLTDQVHTLEQTFAENSPLIRHNIVSGLIRHRIATKEELEGRLRMLDYRFELPCYFAALVDIESFSGGKRSLQESQSAKYNLIKIFENYTYEGSQFLATDISDHEIALIVNSRVDTIDFQTQALKIILSGIFADPQRFPTTSIGGCVKNPLELHVSFEAAQQVRKYTYFLTGNKFLNSDFLLARDASELTFDDSLMVEFKKALRLNKLDLTLNYLDQMLGKMATDVYSFDYCSRMLAELVSDFGNYAKQLGIVPNRGGSSLFARYQEITNIDNFRDWFASTISEAFTQLDNRSTHKNFTAIDDARKYILDNIESELYLNNVAEQVALKPQYFSKLFKEYTGGTFVAFVNTNKMEHSSQLLLESDLSVSDVSDRLSFSSAAYFIKKFKSQFGMTPNEYRNRKLREQNLRS